MEEDKCIECDSNLKRIKIAKGDKEVIWMKCLNGNCSLCYVLTEAAAYDIGRWRIRGKDGMKEMMDNGDVQVSFFSFLFLFFYLNI
jgi:hypothetical protein